jgi:hypothetical protein
MALRVAAPYTLNPPAPTARRAAHAICVLGFHRSGTSMLTRLLNLMGVDVGPEDELLGPVAGDNARGYWEPVWLIELNDAILTQLGGTDWQPPAPADGWERSPALTALRARAHERLDTAYGDRPVWGFKDPRLCLTLPFWQSVLAERGDRVSYLVALRSPAETAASMGGREYYAGADAAHWGRVWLEYTARALAGTAGRPRTLVFYDDLLTEGPAELRRIAAFVGLPWPDGAAAERLDAAIEGGLRHHASTLVDTARDAELPAATRAAYLGLRAAAEARAAADGADCALADGLEHVVGELWREAAAAAAHRLELPI